MISGENPLLKHAPDLVGAEKRGPRKILFPGLILCVPIGGSPLRFLSNRAIIKAIYVRKKGPLRFFVTKC
jgi:hypothetical protein